MELIIKPTEACNFKCTFCSSTNITNTDKKKKLEHEKIFQFLERFPETNSIIINGGDPLMMPPDYYWKILERIESLNLETNLAFTTNLWGFYKNPTMWTDLFKHPKVGVTTSFNYGTTRRITESKVYTEEIFREVMEMFFNYVGYLPGFISVITEENYATAMDNVYLAKELDVECKLNYALMSGDQKQPFLKGHIYKIYLEIIRMGLHPWEYNSKQILRMKDSQATTCPLNRSCDSNIRVLQPEGDYYSCGAFGDDKSHPISFESEVVAKGPKVRPLTLDPEIQILKSECLTCPLFKVCNGCKKTISDLKRLDWVEIHCQAMQQNLSELGGLINDEKRNNVIN